MNASTFLFFSSLVFEVFYEKRIFLFLTRKSLFNSDACTPSPCLKGEVRANVDYLFLIEKGTWGINESFPADLVKFLERERFENIVQKKWRLGL